MTSALHCPLGGGATGGAVTGASGIEANRLFQTAKALAGVTGRWAEDLQGVAVPSRGSVPTAGEGRRGE